MERSSLPREKRWILPPPADAAAVQALMAQTRLPELVCRLLMQRGVTSVDAARAFLAPRLDHLHDPFRMKGVNEMVDHLVAARERGDLIGIMGDYDVDGLTSTALYTRALRDMGFRVMPFVPHRMIDGYGVAVRAIEMFVEAGVKVMLTCDTGSSAVPQVAKAVDEHGLIVLITDHHLTPGEALPKAHALVNPHQPGDTYPYPELCGVGVAFKALQALVRRLGLAEADVLYPYLDLVALGTVADVVPLTGENRVLVKWGLRTAAATRNPGLRAMCKAAQIEVEKLSERDFAWAIAPRFNAAGRIDDAAKGLELLLTDDPARAEVLAKELDQLNVERRAMTQGILENALDRLSAMDLSDVYGIVLYGEPDAKPVWHHGVIGIVASKVVEAFGRPTMLLAWDEGKQVWKGSGRAPRVETVHLKDALDRCAEHLAAYGGHKRAAGATLAGSSAEAMAAFAQAFNEAARAQMKPEERIPAIFADVETTIDQIDWAAFDMLERFAPFGEENPRVHMIVRGAEVVKVRVMGKESTHLKLTVRQNGATLDAVGWGFAATFPELAQAGAGSKVDLFFRVEKNEFNGSESLQLKLEDLRVVELVVAPVASGVHGSIPGGARGAPAADTGASDSRYAPKRLFA